MLSRILFVSTAATSTVTRRVSIKLKVKWMNRGSPELGGGGGGGNTCTPVACNLPCPTHAILEVGQLL